MARISSRTGLLLLLVSSMLSVTHAFSHENETALRSFLLKDYDKTVRPESPTYILVEYVLFSLNELVIEAQEMSITGVLYLRWTDNRLAWDPAQFENMTTIMVDYDTFWQPALYIENAVSSLTAVGVVEKPALRIYAESFTKWIVPQTFSVFCNMKIFSYPFDTQECTAILFSLYDHKEVFLYIDGSEMPLEFYNENGEWDLIGASKHYGNKTDSQETIIQIHIEFKFQRKWRFYTMSMIVPAVLNSFLMSVVFALPFNSGEKMGYALTVLLTYIVLLTLVTDNLPPVSNDTSALQIYLTGVMCIGTVATLLTVWTVTIFYLDPNKPRPRWLVYLCRRLIQPCLCPAAKVYDKNASCYSNKSNMTTKDERRADKSRERSVWSNAGASSEAEAYSQNRQSHTNMLGAYPVRRFHSAALERSYQLPQFHHEQRNQDIVDNGFSRIQNGNPLKASGENKASYRNGAHRPFDDNDENEFDSPRSVYAKIINREQNLSRKLWHQKNGEMQGQFTRNFNHRAWPGNDHRAVSETPSRGPDGQNDIYQSIGKNSSKCGTFTEGENADDISWEEVANIMDAVFLRIISVIIAVGTLALIIFFAIVYH